MNYEQKYKKLVDAIKVMRDVNPSDEGLQNWISDNVPELAESEDERIRKEIIDSIKELKIIGTTSYREKAIAWLEKLKVFAEHGDGLYYFGNNGFTYVGNPTCDNVSWLEKQGEKPQGKTALEAAKEEKVDNANKVEHLIPQQGMYYTCIKDYYSSDNTHLCVKGNVYKSFFNGYIDDESHLGLSWTNSCAEKYFEPTKDEDWIVCEHNNVIGKPMQYKEFKKKVNQNFIKNLKAKGITPKLRLWVIEDAKDGDILYAKGSYFKEYVFKFSSFTEDNVISTHFGYDIFHGTFDTKLSRFGRKEDFVSVTPATQEQRDLLFQKMEEEGYELDADEKELKKIESKFNVGDWVVTDKDATVQIGAVNNGYYTINNGMDFSISYVDKYWRLWTIKDAKDGDILYYKSYNNIEYIVMNKGINMHGNIDSYFRYNSLDGFAVDVPSVLSAENDNITLATKEQRDLLFSKMRESGYEWDAENKVLKKIEPKFKVGDWIIHQGTENIYQVVACIDNQYQLKYGDTYTIQKCDDVDRHARLFDAAKDLR